MNIYGAIDMVDGMEHHFSSFRNLTDKLSLIPMASDEDKELQRHLRHEVIAYLNRMGQFYHFAKSSFVASRIANVSDIIPTICKFKYFRDKHSAHRSIDYPRPEDTRETQRLHAWQFSSIGGCLFCPKDKSAFSMTEKRMSEPNVWWKECFFGIQLRLMSKDEFIEFFLEREHPIISHEAFALMEKLLSE